MPTDQQTAALAAIDACVVALGVAVADLRASLAAPASTDLPTPPVEPPVEPPPPPPPPVDPPIEPPPTDSVPELFIEEMPVNGRVFFGTYKSGSSNYDRYQSLWRLTGDTTDVTLRRNALGGKFPARTFTVTANGQRIGEVAMPEGADRATGTCSIAGLPESWLTMKIEGLAEGENAPTWFAFRYIDGSTSPERMPVVTGTAELNYEGRKHGYAWIPTRFTPSTRPLEPQQYAPFSDTPHLVGVNLTPGTGDGDIRVPNVDRYGVMSTFGLWVYAWETMGLRLPMVPLLDGPRGRASTPYVTHMQIGTGIGSAGPRNHLYCTDGWRCFRVSDTGDVKTLFGWRHKDLMSYSADADERYRKVPAPKTLELVGDWSAVPKERRGLWECWGMCVDRRTVAINEGAAPIPSEGNDKPHLTGPGFNGPVFYAANTRHGTINRAEFSAVLHAAPAVVTEWITGLSEPWDIVEYKGTAIVSEHAGNRILQYDMATGALIRVLVERDAALPGDAKFNVMTRLMNRVDCTLDEARAQPCLGPQGLYVVDDTLYYGSHVCLDIKKLDLLTGEIETALLVPSHVKGRFVKFAVSDGTFGPKGTLFVCTHGTSPSAGGAAYLPDGTQWGYASAAPWAYNQGYPYSVAARDGRLYFYATGTGITRMTPGAQINGDLYKRGKAEYRQARLNLLYGPSGFSPSGYVCPRGTSDAVDYYLEVEQAP